jgi:uncharacterized protein (UPF0332 family)
LETWEQLSEDSLRAAESLLREGRYRSCVSRAYYSAYCAATSEIVKKLTTFSHGWKNPAHEKVPVYVQSNLILAQTKKDIIVKLITTLRLFREDADYRPHITVDEQIAKDCIRDATQLQKGLLKGGK